MAPASSRRASPRFVDAHAELIHIRTKRNSPGQNGVRERAFGSLKYEHLYRHEIDDGHDLGLDVEPVPAALQHRPAAPSPRRQTPARRPPRSLSDNPQTTKSNEPETLPLS